LKSFDKATTDQSLWYLQLSYWQHFRKKRKYFYQKK